ncbi:MAG TPA: hypothetical protein VHP33_30250 [Polyangiaceae bacterium]|nr:hypothetical protein [Polyangiaceae bacterium]
MSLSTDVLAKATPTRLVCRGGRWVLELTRLEAVDRDVFQPRLTRLEGPDSILAVLRRSEEGQLLASGAAQIMRSPRTEEDRAFEVNEGDWVPTSDAGFSRHHSHSPSPGHTDGGTDASELISVVAELRAELAVLRASHARLRDRVIALEASQSGIAQPNLRGTIPRGPRSQRRRSEPPPAFSPAQAEVEPLAPAAAFAATQASPALGDSREAQRPGAPVPGVQEPAAKASQEPQASPSAAPHQSFEELAKAMVGEQPPPVLTVPSLRSLSECLAGLLESPPPLEPTPAKEISLDGLSKPQACKLLDDEGRERGAIILDLRAALLLGAGLLALPRDEALRQLKENEPSEDALLATSEICNNLTGPINAVSGNAHVRSTAMTSVDVSALPKLRARLDLTVDGGRLVVAFF